MNQRLIYKAPMTPILKKLLRLSICFPASPFFSSSTSQWAASILPWAKRASSLAAHTAKPPGRVSIVSTRQFVLADCTLKQLQLRGRPTIIPLERLLNKPNRLRHLGQDASGVEANDLHIGGIRARSHVLQQKRSGVLGQPIRSGKRHIDIRGVDGCG